MIAALPSASSDPSQRSDADDYSKNMPALETAPDDSPKSVPADWTCYSAGAYTTDWVARAAEDPAAPTDILSMLAESCNVEVRMAVADNPSALPETVMMLAQDASDDLRYQLAENHNIPRKVLNLLADDSHPFVAQRAQKTIRRLEGGAVVIDVVPRLKITRLGSAESMKGKLKRMPL